MIDVAVVEVANDIWADLVVASTIKAPFLITPYYNEMIKKEDKTDYKLLSALMVEEYRAVPPKTNWIRELNLIFFCEQLTTCPYSPVSFAVMQHSS